MLGFTAETENRPTGGLGAAGPSAGGSSAVEQRTVKCAQAQPSFGREFKSPSPELLRFCFCRALAAGRTGAWRAARTSSYDHTTVKAPHPIRTAKLSTVGPDQYYGRGLRGNLRCCKAFFCFLQNNFFFQKIKFKKSGEGDLNSRPKDGCACALYSPLLYR